MIQVVRSSVNNIPSPLSMHKKSLLPLIAVFTISAGIVYGLTASLFPDTTEFPRLPTWPGTIGWVIAKLIGTTGLDTYIWDGTVGDTRMLSGVTASGYLKPVTCTLLGWVMVGVDVDGEAICGPKNKLLVGTWTEWAGAEKCAVGSAICTTLTIGESLFEWDIVKTLGTSTGTITFTDDLSLLRLDVGTVVELQKWENNVNETVAQAILNNGQLWWRIVSNTGVNIGWGGVIAGVRGTSLVMSLSSTGQISLNIVDSMAPFSSAYLMTYPYPTWAMPISAQRIVSYASWSVPSASVLVSNILPKSREVMYSGSLWIRENTKKDIEYLYQKQNTMPNPVLAEAELTATLVPTDTAALEWLCGPTGTSVYWPSLVGTKHDKCRAKNLYAFADYTKPLFISPTSSDMNLYTMTWLWINSSWVFTWSPCIPWLPNGCKITNYDYIKYSSIISLWSKKWKITFTNSPILNGAGLVAFSGGALSNQMIVISRWGATWFHTNWFPNPPSLVTSQTSTWVLFNFPPTAVVPLIIGNYPTSYNNAFSSGSSSRIQKIEIFY